MVISMEAWGKSDKGLVRPTNQDAFQTDIMHELSLALLTVCDGMGGANAGNVASRHAIDGFTEEVKRSIRPDMSLAYIKGVMVHAIGEANRAVYDLSLKQPEFRGMGTTIVSVISTEHYTVAANVGDSRAYLIDGAHMTQITKDHSLIEEMLRRGKITPEAAKIHPGKNLITRAVGVDRQVECDLFELSLEKNQILLLCSDGLCGQVPDEDILNTVRGASDLRHASEQLVDLALRAGGQDNITVVLFTK